MQKSVITVVGKEVMWTFLVGEADKTSWQDWV